MYFLTSLPLEGSHNVTIEYLPGDVFVTSAILRYGLMPCAPFQPTTAIALRVLELYRISHLRCPQLSINAFVKTLCDLHCQPFKAYLSRQFSIAFDLYLSIRTSADKMVQIALGRDSPDWKLMHACPPCMYILEDEPTLKFSMLYTVDGGDSLKRIIRRDVIPNTLNATDPPVLGNCSESIDTREIGAGMYLTNANVDKWSKEILAQTFPTQYDEDPSSTNTCAQRWHNMREELTAKMWGVFEETGLFLALCRHGFVLLLADMVRSGEL